MSEAHAIRIGNMAAPAIETTPTNITAAATTAAATAAPGEQPGPGANVVTRRRADACATCHHKKIRCDLDPSAYRPCSSCASLGIPCRRRQRKSYAYAALRFLRPLLSRKDSAAASRKASSTTNIPPSNNNTGVTTPATNNTCNNIAGNSVISRMNSGPATNDSDILGTPATTLLGQAHEAVPYIHNSSDTRDLPNTVSADIHSDSRSIAVQGWGSALSPDTAPSAGGFSVSSSTGRASAAATELFFSGEPSSLIPVRSPQC
ncbi:hypothetical protein KCU73_g1258, partial [Aureobasidium melanogenum]